jgi:hypothetical protein
MSPLLKARICPRSPKKCPTPHPRHEKSVNAVFDQVIAWGGALKTLREK